MKCKLLYFTSILALFFLSGINIYIINVTQDNPISFSYRYSRGNTPSNYNASRSVSNFIAASTFTQYVYDNLPNFASDNSEYFIGSILNFDAKAAFVTVLLLSHHLLTVPQLHRYFKRTLFHSTDRKRWRNAFYKFKYVAYTESGQRTPMNQSASNIDLYCKIFIDKIDMVEFAEVKGSFVPNRLTMDSNANRRLDILRCPFPPAVISLIQINSKSNLHVEIHRRTLNGTQALIRFLIPFETGRTGLFFSSLAKAAGTSQSVSYPSQRVSTNVSGSNDAQQPVIHLCLPAVRRLISRETVGPLLEFVAHHLHIGVRHIYVPSPTSAFSDNTRRLSAVLRSYVSEGRVSIIPQSDGVAAEEKFTFGGIMWDFLLIKVVQSNACLYAAKGVADYLLILDADEFLIPRTPSRWLPSILRAAHPSLLEPPRSGIVQGRRVWRGGPGWADADGHPLCFLAAQSQVLLPAAVTSPTRWLATRFPHAAEVNTSRSAAVSTSSYSRVILPTSTIFYTGLNSPGACKLSDGWDGCAAEGHCRSIGLGQPRRLGEGARGEAVDFRRDHYFDEAVGKADSRLLREEEEVVVYHFTLFNQQVLASSEARRGTNDYARSYAAAAMEDIRRRGLDVLVDLPDTDSSLPMDARESAQNPAKEQWQPLFSVAEAREDSAADSMGRTRKDDASKQPLSPRNDSEVVRLPAFAADYSEYILSAILEREAAAFDLQLAVFFMCHTLLQPRDG